MGEFCFRQSVRKLPKNLGKVLSYESYFQKSNINWKSLIWCKYKIITKFGAKKYASFIFGKVHESCPKIKENWYFRKHASKRVILSGNHLFDTIIR